MRYIDRPHWELHINTGRATRRRSTWNKTRRPLGEMFHVEQLRRIGEPARVASTPDSSKKSR